MPKYSCTFYSYKKLDNIAFVFIFSSRIYMLFTFLELTSIGSNQN